MDDEYRDRIALAVWKALVETSMVDVAGKRISMVQSGECVFALIQIIGVLMAASEATSSPTKLREACDSVAKRLRTWTTSVREDGSAWSIFDRVVEEAMQ